MRYYYKRNDNSALLSLKTPDYDNKSGYTRITEEEWNARIAQLKNKQ